MRTGTPVTHRTDLLSPLSIIPGFGDKRLSALRQSGIETIGDLLHMQPLRYIDRTRIVPIGELNSYIDDIVSVIGTIERARVERGRKSRLRLLIRDESGTFEVLFFNGVSFMQSSMQIGSRRLFTGRVSLNVHLQMVHPSSETMPEGANAPTEPILPRYSLSEEMREAGVGQAVLCKAVKWAVDKCEHWPEILPAEVEKSHSFVSPKEAVRMLHFPLSMSEPQLAKDRLAYEELWRLCVSLHFSRRKFDLPGRSLVGQNLVRKLIENLPFGLSVDQKSAIEVLHADSASVKRMHRLLMGDVGSGKTITAIFACLPSIESGLQVAWLAPTEILARQSFNQINEISQKLGFTAGILTGSTAPSQRRELLAALADGSIQFLVGTHALLQPAVRFKAIGQVVIDEQHKFGVEQRRTLQMKDPAADFLLLSATPIPQTLAQTIYGDLDPVLIRQSHRKVDNVNTRIVPIEKLGDMYSFIAKELAVDARAFFVAPRIETTEENGPDGIDDVVSAIEKSPLDKCGISVLHGRQKPEERNESLAAFLDGKRKVLVATTVIEVGVDVSQASVIVIESAEWFGLSQLHQLRGRVGRDGRKAWCFLVPSTGASPDAIDRLRKFSAENNGFTIAELDLSLRGPGEVAGFRQTGAGDLHFADILRDAELFREISARIKALMMV